jgi:hypothetical protein
VRHFLLKTSLQAALSWDNGTAGTPEEYQPAYFRELQDADRMKFAKKPFHLNVR